MNCGHCGNEVVPGAMACLKCGALPATGRTYCTHCGKPTLSPEAAFCTVCGSALGSTAGVPVQKDWLAALLLCLAIFLGFGGLHRFYSGHVGIGILQLITFGGCGIWALYDLIMIITDQYRDINGRLIVRH